MRGDDLNRYDECLNCNDEWNESVLKRSRRVAVEEVSESQDKRQGDSRRLCTLTNKQTPEPSLPRPLLVLGSSTRSSPHVHAMPL